MYQQGDQFIDICFETASPVFKILNLFNDFISLSNTNSIVYQIALGSEVCIKFR